MTQESWQPSKSMEMQSVFHMCWSWGEVVACFKEATRGRQEPCLPNLGSAQLLRPIRFLATPWTAAHQASLSITDSWSLLNSCPLSWWCHPTVSSSVIPFSSCLQSFPASGSVPMGQFFAWGGQTIGVSTSASVLPMNIQDRSPLGWTGWVSWQSKGLSRVFSNTTVQKHQFFSAQLSL